MSMRLKDRNHQIPGGLQFFVQETSWRPYPYSSFETIVRQLIEHRRANPKLTEQNHWSIQYETVCDEVDRFNAQICERQSWSSYIVNEGGEGPPKASPWPSRGVVARVAVGADTIVEMFGEEGPIRDSAQALARAQVCAQCPQNNTRHSIWSFFAAPASNLIRGMLGWLKDEKMKTPLDEKLGVCDICYCPMKLKVWARHAHIVKHMDAADFQKLPDFCWIKTEIEPPHA